MSAGSLYTGTTRVRPWADKLFGAILRADRPRARNAPAGNPRICNEYNVLGDSDDIENAVSSRGGRDMLLMC